MLGLAVQIRGVALVTFTFVVNLRVVLDLGTLKLCLVVDILAAAGDQTSSCFKILHTRLLNTTMH